MARLNQVVASGTGLSRRAADAAIAAGQVKVNETAGVLGQQVSDNDKVELDGQVLNATPLTYLVMNKPIGYVCSRRVQGSNPTIYALLPPELHHLKPVGRLDKDSCGLLLLTNDGQWAQKLTHPSHGKQKRYLVQLDQNLKPADRTRIEKGVQLEDGLSQLKLESANSGWHVSMREGRNRQIRRTFAKLGYKIRHLERISLGDLELGDLPSGQYRRIQPNEILE